MSRFCLLSKAKIPIFCLLSKHIFLIWMELDGQLGGSIIFAIS